MQPVQPMARLSALRLENRIDTSMHNMYADRSTPSMAALRESEVVSGCATSSVAGHHGTEASVILLGF